MENLKKIIQKELKLQSKTIQLDDIEIKYKKDAIFFLHKNNEVGYLGYTFVSNKFADYDSQLGMYISCRFGKEMKGYISITEVIDRLNLPYGTGANLPNCFFGFTSLYYLSSKIDSCGIVSFSEKENVGKKIREIIEKIKELYLPKVLNFIYHTDNLIDDIIEYPQNYGYPMAYILITCYLNNKAELIENIIEKTKSKKMYDNSPNKIRELKLILAKYFKDKTII